MHQDFDRCYGAVQSRDARFDGWFVTAVLTTGIYCRPSCPVRLPLARNVRFYATAAAAQLAGFRSCKRCRPDASAGSPEWNVRSDTVARAMRLIADGTVDREGVNGLSVRLGYTTRQLERMLRAEVGAGPLALARAQRVQTARVLIETTNLPFGDVAFGAGFTSIRQFNDTVRAACGCTPTALRHNALRTRSAEFGQTIVLKLPARSPFGYEGAFGHLAATAVPGCEEVRDGAYRRSLRLPGGPAIVSLTPYADHVSCVLTLARLADLTAAVERCRRLLDLDADPRAVDEALRVDPALKHAVNTAPGQRIPRAVDAHELALRTVLGQQISTAAARTHAARLVRAHGDPVDDPGGGITHTFPDVTALADLDTQALAMPKARRRAFLNLVCALAEGTVELDPGTDWQRARAQLGALPGIGPWTVELVAMRGLGDPDAFPASDLGLRTASQRLGLGVDAELVRRSDAWRPWRSYATQYLWTTLDHPVNTWPAQESA